MSTLLIFLGCLAGIALFGFVVSRITGARAQFIETLPLLPGELVLWEDFEADAYPIETRRAPFVTYVRSGRRAVRVTNRRILSGCRPLFGPNHLLEHVLYPSDRPFPEEANGLGGGALTRGFKTLVFERGNVVQSSSEKHPFVDLALSEVKSSLNLSAFRIYSDRLGAFRLPEG